MHETLHKNDLHVPTKKAAPGQLFILYMNRSIYSTIFALTRPTSRMIFSICFSVMDPASIEL